MKKFYLILITVLLFNCSSNNDDTSKDPINCSCNNDDTSKDPIIGLWYEEDDGVCNPPGTISFLIDNTVEETGTDTTCAETQDLVYEYTSWRNVGGGNYIITFKRIDEEEKVVPFSTVITKTTLCVTNDENEVFKFTKFHPNQ